MWVPFVAWGPLIVRGNLAHKSLERGLITLPKSLQRAWRFTLGRRGVSNI